MATNSPTRTRTAPQEPSAARAGSRAHSSRRRARRRWPIRVAEALIVAVVLVLGVLLVALVVTPPATQAPGRVAAILAAHSAPSDGGVVPYKVGEALLATEDSRYESDWAIDPQGTLRALWGLVTRNPNEGGATIEVQLAKMLWTPRHSDPASLLEQVAMAIKLDHDYSKSRILALYLDAAYFGDGAYGITAASEHYFGVAPDRLSWGQAALLAGLVQAPTRYDPHGHLSVALARRSHVLARMVATGEMTRAQAASVAAAPLDPAIPFYG